MEDGMSRLEAWRLRDRATLAEVAQLAMGHSPGDGYPDEKIAGAINTIENALIERIVAPPNAPGPNLESVKVVWSDPELGIGINPYHTTVDLKEVAEWFKFRGFRCEFAFLDREVDKEDFLDPDHPYFAPELALAVHAWRGVAKTGPGPLGAVRTLRGWIRDHPEVWVGKDPISEDAAKRVAVVANWNKRGGAPRTPFSGAS